MAESSLTPQPFMDWFGIWPGQAGRDEKGRAWLEDPPQGIRLRVQPARKSEPFLRRGERPWQEQSLGHLTMLLEAGRYRMWYQPAAPGESVTFTCYAESEDGFNWEYPELGLYEFRGSKRNNIICDSSYFLFNSVFRDPRAPESERYKGIEPQVQVYRRGALVPTKQQTKQQTKQEFREIREIRETMGLEGHTPEQIDAEAEIRHGVRGAVSPDGLRWKVLEEPLIDVGKTLLDTQNIAAYDEDTGEYVAYLRGHVERRRGVRRTGGKEFGNWPATRTVLMADQQDEPDEDLYTSAYCRCPGSGRRVMFPSVFHRLSATVDIHLATSRDGWDWSRPARHSIISRDTDEGPYGCIYARPNLVPLGEEWGLPYYGHDQRHDTWGAGPYFGRNEYRWALWKPDRLVGLEAPVEGQFTTVERVCQGQELRLNFQTQVGGWIRVALAHKPTTPPAPVQELEGFWMEECDVLEGDEVSRTVSWRGRSDLSTLKGRELSVRIRMARAKLFSLAL